MFFFQKRINEIKIKELDVNKQDLFVLEIKEKTKEVFSVDQLN